ncbi:oxygenase MpaB family protein [Alloactinosynnema sp. L-07]|uniref:oxygenase MpaB family protein n=1 Tax=Alloactinosynnema sp. L-07 TaxID=1653480 RepID=UPI0009EF5E47|nr:oxygenase MpaB family protein [Alloactinosynnema sp. L-07]
MDRRHYVKLIETLDPDVDYEKIIRYTALHDFTFDTALSLQMAFYRTYAIPGIAAVLGGSGEIAARPIKRGEDTGLMVFEIIEHGFDHPRSQRVLNAMNAMHSRWDITNDQFLYVLGVFLIPWMRWLRNYGWRQPTATETAAAHRFYAEMGGRMGITDIPATFEAFEQWFDRYESIHLAPNEHGQRLLHASHKLFTNRFPPRLAFLGITFGNALLDDALRHALGVNGPSAPARGLIRLIFKVRARILRWHKAPTNSGFTPDGVTPGYPDGYSLEQLGPPQS